MRYIIEGELSAPDGRKPSVRSVWFIENGKIQYPVKNFRFNQSIIQMLAPGNVEMVGASERVGGSEGGGASLLPALKLKAFNFTSQSEAV